MTVESLQSDPVVPGRSIATFKFPGESGPLVKIIENIASGTEAGTREFVVEQDGTPEVVMGLRRSTSYGDIRSDMYLGIAAVEPGTEIDPEVLQVSAEVLLDAEGIEEAYVPSEARGVEEEKIEPFGTRERTFGMYAIKAVSHDELAVAA